MGAVISDCGQYRYRLTRGEEPRLAIVMLNPSTADANLDDPTIRRCLSFAAREGYKGIEVMNAYALRSTDPKALRTHPEPAGPKNHEWLNNLAVTHHTILCAWGANLPEIDQAHLIFLLRSHRSRLVCLGKTKSGAPRHPLYVPNSQPFLDFP